MLLGYTFKRMLSSEKASETGFLQRQFVEGPNVFFGVDQRRYGRQKGRQQRNEAMFAWKHLHSHWETEMLVALRVVLAA